MIRFLPNEVKRKRITLAWVRGAPGQGQGRQPLPPRHHPRPDQGCAKAWGTCQASHAIQTILFDLDGTLTDSEPGIVNSVRYALRVSMEAEPATLRSFIGPPLYDSFGALWA